MGVLRGKVFEKAGVNISTVYGKLSKDLVGKIPGTEKTNNFWASGISLVVHPKSPHIPAVHMNTRMFWTPHGWWFGGGSDLNPCLEYEEDTAHFHDTQARFLAPHGADLYPRLKKWADDYFYIPHRKCARGVGGIFMDDHCTGDWACLLYTSPSPRD